MALRTNRNINTNDTATIALAGSISGNVAVLCVSANDDRIYVAITVTKKGAFVRLEPAATSNATRQGVLVSKDATYELPSDNMYTGEISIINIKTGDKPTFYVTEY